MLLIPVHHHFCTATIGLPIRHNVVLPPGWTRLLYFNIVIVDAIVNDRNEGESYGKAGASGDVHCSVCTGGNPLSLHASVADICVRTVHPESFFFLDFISVVVYLASRTTRYGQCLGMHRSRT